MMHCYAQINDAGVCTGVSALSDSVVDNHMIPVEFVDGRLVGQIWMGQGWIEAPAQPDRTLTRLAFRNRFTFEEKQAIYTAAEGSVAIRIFLDDINAAEEINLDDPATQYGVQTLEVGGLIAAGRAAEVLA